MTSDPREHVQRTLDQLLPGTRVMRYKQSTHTAEAAAAAVGCPVGAIVKSLLFLVDGRPVLVLASGDQQVSDTKLAQRFNVGRKRVRMGDAASVLELTGYAVGGVSPVGHPQPLPALMDGTLERFDVLYAAAGTADTAFPVTPADLRRITGAETADLTR